MAGTALIGYTGFVGVDIYILLFVPPKMANGSGAHRAYYSAGPYDCPLPGIAADIVVGCTVNGSCAFACTYDATTIVGSAIV